MDTPINPWPPPPSKWQNQSVINGSLGKTAGLGRVCAGAAAVLLPEGRRQRRRQGEHCFPQHRLLFCGGRLGLAVTGCGKRPVFGGKVLTTGENSILQEG